MSNKNTYWGKDSRCLELATLPSSYDNCLEIWEPQLFGTLNVSKGFNVIASPLLLVFISDMYLSYVLQLILTYDYLLSMVGRWVH
jgi:hypothetical protein